MRARIFFEVVSVVNLALITACSVSTFPSAEPTSAEPSSAPSGTIEASELAAPAPGVSWVRVSPQQGVPGSAVSIDVACLDALGAVHSPVLDIGALRGSPDGHQPWRLMGLATVRPDADPGRYSVSTTCGGSELSTAFTVVPARSR